VTKISLSSFFINKKQYFLKKYIEINVDEIFDKNSCVTNYHAYNYEFSIFGFGATIEEAAMDIESDLAHVYTILTSNNESELTFESKQLKRRLLEIVS